MWARCGAAPPSSDRSRRHVARRRVLHQVGADHREHEEDDRRRNWKVPRQPMLFDQAAGQRAEDAGTGGEDADRQAVDQPAMIRKPLRADRDRREVAEAEADADHHAPRQIQHRQRLRVAGEKQTRAVQQAADGRDWPRADAILDACPRPGTTTRASPCRWWRPTRSACASSRTPFRAPARTRSTRSRCRARCSESRRRRARASGANRHLSIP